jgi:glutamine synthetase
MGLAYVAGLLEHAAEGVLLCVPTVNGYRRLDDRFSLSPDRVVWSAENRGALVRVLGTPGDPTTHVENRLGEPTANPYLYLAAQIAAGMDGADRGLDPGPPATDPHAPWARPLPTDLRQALAEFGESSFYRTVLGDPLTDCLRLLKQSELTRYEQWLAKTEPTDGELVTEWEHREYFANY